ncbi:hypothetical protein HD806DRAFT_537883 [Xylariaceae sp. AK1471]|nr:hypothetical protein HD806DRAFT_537883 [Xylariaceae sp. AK1471]
MSMNMKDCNSSLMAFWNEALMQTDAPNRTIKLTTSAFNGLGDDGEAFFLRQSALLLNTPTEFVSDGSNMGRVYLGNPEEMENTLSSLLLDIPGNRLRTLCAIPEVTAMDNTGIFSNGNDLMAAMNASNGIDEQIMFDPAQYEDLNYPVVQNPSQNIQGYSSTPQHGIPHVTMPTIFSDFRMPMQAPAYPSLSPPTMYGYSSASPSPSRKRKMLGTAHKDDAIPEQEHVPKPMNAFFIFRRHHHRLVAEQNKKMPNGQVSQVIANMWKSMSKEEKEPWFQQARAVAEEHKRLYPDYKCRPKPTNAKRRKAGKTQK